MLRRSAFGSLAPGASASQLEDAGCVAVEDLLAVLGAELDGLEPLRPRLVLLEGVVDREEYAVDAQLHDAVEHRRRGEEAALGHVEVAAERLSEVDRLVPRAREAVVNAPEGEGFSGFDFYLQ